MIKLLRLFLYHFVFLNVINHINSANILALSSLPSPSHHIWHVALVNALASKNHNITFVTTDLDKIHPENVHYIHLEGVYNFLYNGSEPFDIFSMAKDSPLATVIHYPQFCIITCEELLNSNGYKTILNYPDNFKFDIVIYDFVCGPCLLGLLHKFNYPTLVSATAFNIPAFTVNVIGGHSYYGYIPHYALDYDTNMSFWQRIHNVIVYNVDNICRTYIKIPKINKMVRKLISDCPDLGLLEQKSVLALVNFHPAVDFPEPTLPNVIPVGGLQIQPSKILSKELENFINQSKKGAVLFSLGTNIRSDKLGADRQEMLLDAFKQMPDYNFLWKFETNTLPVEIPKNVLIKSWMPQNDILAHPKIKAFITHAGLLSTHEATWHGVPMIGIPVFLDQHRNILKAINAGAAVKLNFQTMTTNDIREKILKVLEDPSYHANMKIRSERFRDQPEKPIDRAIWWIEWALRNPNPSHLESPVLRLGYIKANNYDIMLIFIILSFVICIYSYKILQYAKNSFKKRVKIDSKKKK